MEDLEEKCIPEIPDTCLCEVSETGDCLPRPAVSRTVDAWDDDHVRLPCSPQNIQKDRPVKQWSIIQEALSGSIHSAEDFKAAVLRYNADYADRSWNVDVLAAALQLRPEFGPLLKKIADLALKLPYLIMQPIPLMKRNQESSISLSQMQIACLLANAFYCTFPGRSGTNNRGPMPPFPSVNFNTLFNNPSPKRAEAAATQLIHKQHMPKVQKVICILHYFSRVLADDGAPTRAVTFARRCLNHPPDFEASSVLIGSVPLGTSSTCLIEDAGSDCLQVAFASRRLGGGVLNTGCVQEEILLCIAPEILVGRLFLQTYLPHEAILIFGAERYSNYTGYSRNFMWAGDFRETLCGTVRDKQGRWKKVVTVIDAVCFSNPVLQFQTGFLRRELHKAYAGFTDIAAPYRSLPAIVVSGHWGCGAFRGNKALKALLQLMACAQAGKALAYSTFGEEHFGEELLRMYDRLADSQCTVGRLWYILTHLEPPEMQTSEELSEYVFKAVQQQLTSKET